ncbi:EGFR-like transmembrane domain-containing protein [Aspergillus saccharolyticus JOP 1030-1]|uniref:Uncharacterized protein n=1 Tax=Aspergillus saccharolyticus JOP 1030-1 TaxID=1450539 RepID=A0A319AAW6_9EURO|nr:hypothetical protein BP01DRAFT_401534 [Aspergillus saccharolyticus JOP 1030-1]PYH44082.1 hypothetical protein BP01DRAFT_401534 [Aspergillus saccharolyticus JOP 1030-1]
MTSLASASNTKFATPTSTAVSIPGYSGAYNRGPETTTFSPPITCRQSATMYTADDGAGAAAGTIYYGHWWSGDMACYPTGTIPATSYTHFQFWYSYYYSPGYYCPSSWHTAATLADGWAGETLTGSRNGVLCCPSGLTLYNNWTHACATSVSPGDVITLVTNFVAVETTISVSSVLFQDGIPLIRDEFITATNNPSTTITPAPTPSSTMPQATGDTTIPAATQSSPHAGDKISAELSTVAKAGIGVGIGLAVVLLVGAGLFFFMRARRRKRQTSPPSPCSDQTAFIQELHSKPYQRPVELPARPYVSELESRAHVSELPG